MITFLTVPSRTIFGKQHVLVVCMILLVRLPSALTRLRGCFPQALLASAVRCGEGLLLPNGPSMAEGGGPQQRGPQRRGPPPPLPGVVRGCRAVPPEVGWGWGGDTLAFVGPCMDCMLQISRAAASSLATGKFSSLPFLNLFAVRDFKSNVFPHTFPEKADLHMH